jgi:hypothetical protein
MRAMSQLHCPTCRQKVLLSPDEDSCPRCKTKLRESVAEMERNIALQQTAHTMRRARLWLIIAAGLALALTGMGFLEVADVWDRLPDELKTSLYASTAIGGALVFLWVWAKVQPLPATVIALLLYGGVFVFRTVVAPGSLISLMTLFNGLVLVSLVTGVAAAWRHARLKRQLAAV